MRWNDVSDYYLANIPWCWWTLDFCRSGNLEGPGPMCWSSDSGAVWNLHIWSRCWDCSAYRYLLRGGCAVPLDSTLQRGVGQIQLDIGSLLEFYIPALNHSRLSIALLLPDISCPRHRPKTALFKFKFKFIKQERAKSHWHVAKTVTGTINNHLHH